MLAQILLCDTNADKFVFILLMCALSAKAHVAQSNLDEGQQVAKTFSEGS